MKKVLLIFLFTCAFTTTSFAIPVVDQVNEPVGATFTSDTSEWQQEIIVGKRKHLNIALTVSFYINPASAGNCASHF